MLFFALFVFTVNAVTAINETQIEKKIEESFNRTLNEFKENFKLHEYFNIPIYWYWGIISGVIFLIILFMVLLIVHYLFTMRT